MGYFYAIAAAVVWGLVYAMDQKVLDKVSPHALMFVNSIFSLLYLVPFLLFHKSEWKTLENLDRGNIKFFATTLLCTLIANILIYLAIKELGSSRAAIFEIAYPFFVILFGVVLFREHLNAYFIFGSILLFLGAAIILTKG
jgi:drug/metabolite transporter (DMT)-like permease